MADNAYDITAAFAAIENELIASMIRNMDRHRAEEEKEGMLWSQWQAEQLQALEEYKMRNRKKYGKRFRMLNKRVESLIRMANDTGSMGQEVKILKAIRDGFRGYKRASETLQAEFFKLNERKLEALIKATTDDMQKAETAVLRMANDQYRKTIFNAQVYANSGAGTYEKAVDMATKDMLAAGLNCIQYVNGARHTLSDYADMAIRTASKRAYLQGEGTKRQEWGIATVIMNKRGNPCPKCLPWVGKVLIDDVWSGGKKEGGKYPLMSYAISKGLYHPRCKDVHTTYFPGISTADDTWTEEELEKIGLESREEAKQKHAKRQAEKYERMADNSLDPENRQQYRTRAEKWKKAVSCPEHLPVRNWKKLDVEKAGRIEKELSYLPESHQEILESGGVELEFIFQGNSHYNPGSRTLYIAENFEDFEIVHEAAHAIEDIRGIWEDSEFRSLVDKIAGEHSEQDIIQDDVTFIRPVRRIHDKRFISVYQGRIYDNFDETVEGMVNPSSLWDYFSEGYRCFFENPKLLLEKDPDLFAYIKELADGQ